MDGCDILGIIFVLKAWEKKSAERVERILLYMYTENNGCLNSCSSSDVGSRESSNTTPNINNQCTINVGLEIFNN